jgi:hypothetical protein
MVVDAIEGDADNVEQAAETLPYLLSTRGSITQNESRMRRSDKMIWCPCLRHPRAI